MDAMQGIEILESYCPGSRVNAILDNPVDEGPDEG
jgi:hypothetical protein